MKQRFIIYGMTGWCLEVFWTGFCSLVKADIMMTSHTSIWMFFIYGLAVFLEPLCEAIHELSFYIRGMIYALLIFAVEFFTGYVIKMIFGVAPWDYSHNPFNVGGLIRLDYTPLWFVVGLLFEKYSRFIRESDWFHSERHVRAKE